MHLLNNQILVKKVVEGMKKNSFGRIINIISTSVKAPIPGLGVSNTIRAAVANWAKTLSLELGIYGITVNNVLPGFTNTNRLNSLIKKKAEVQGKSVDEVASQMKKSVPMNRFGNSNEVANAVVFLSSIKASYINGINLPVDGGRTASL
jgi:3-oxoacyl-[acyl-carrier protein] reductase